jgi:polyhydroxyalkanoate synthesis regulator phasin
MASIRELLEQSVLMGLGAVSLTRETAQNLVDEMVKRGQAQREEASEMVEQLIKRGEKERNALRRLIREEVQEVLKELQLPTHADMKAIEKKLDALLQKLEATLAGVGDAPFHAARAQPAALPSGRQRAGAARLSAARWSTSAFTDDSRSARTNCAPLPNRSNRPRNTCAPRWKNLDLPLSSWDRFSALAPTCCPTPSSKSCANFKTVRLPSRGR